MGPNPYHHDSKETHILVVSIAMIVFLAKQWRKKSVRRSACSEEQVE